MNYFERHDPVRLLGWTIIICACLCVASCTAKSIISDIRAIQHGVQK